MKNTGNTTDIEQEIALIAQIDDLEFKKHDVAKKQKRRFKISNILKWIARVSIFVAGFCVGGTIARLIMGWDLAGLIQALVALTSSSVYTGCILAKNSVGKKIVKDKIEYDELCEKQNTLLDEMFKNHSHDFAKDGDINPTLGLGLLVDQETGEPVIMFGIGFSTEPTGLIRKRVEGMADEEFTTETPLLTSGDEDDNKKNDSDTDGTTV